MEPWYIARCTPQRETRFLQQITSLGLEAYSPAEIGFRAISRHSPVKIQYQTLVTPRLIFILGPYWNVWQIEALHDFDGFVRDQDGAAYAIPEPQMRAFRDVIDGRNSATMAGELRRTAKIMAKPNKPKWYKMGGDEMLAAMQAMTGVAA